MSRIDENNPPPIGTLVRATVTRGGYWKDSYQGTFQGFTPSGLIRVEGRSVGYTGRVRCHAWHNVELQRAINDREQNSS